MVDVSWLEHCTLVFFINWWIGHLVDEVQLALYAVLELEPLEDGCARIFAQFFCEIAVLEEFLNGYGKLA